MDSTTALALAVDDYGADRVTGISFNYGQRHRASELAAAYNIAHHYGIKQHEVDLRSLKKLLGGSALTDDAIDVPDGHYAAPTMAITVVPNRNAIMLSIAFGLARAIKACEVYAGMHAGDHAIYPDCRPQFVNAFQRMENAANIDILTGPDGLELCPILVTPFLLKSKQDIVTEGVRLKVPFNMTYSCYKGDILHCGTCGTCTERREAFELAGVEDPTIYAAPTPPTV